MTVRDIVSNEAFKADLAQALKHPNLILAIQALAEENMPDLVIKPVVGLDVMQAIALDAAKRAGAQSVIKKLLKLPYMSYGHLDRAKAMQAPWEYLEPDGSSSLPTKKKAIKQRP